MRISAAWEAVAAGRIDEGVRALVEEWRVHRQPAVAAAIETLSARVRRPAIAGKTVAARQEAFVATAAARDPADVGRLLDILLDANSAEPFQARIEALAAMGADPRVAAALTELVRAQRHFVSKPKAWSAILTALALMGDPRQVEPLREVCPDPAPAPPRIGYNGYPEFRLRDRLAERLPGIIARLSRIVPPPVADGDQLLLDKIAAQAQPPSSEEALLAAIYAAPGDDDARAVYADALLERSDARGELIALQLRRARGQAARGDKKRETQLLSELRPVLLGALAPVVFEPRFERGFLAACRATITDVHRALVTHPAWATVEELSTDDPELLAQPHLRALRRLTVWSYAAPRILRGELALPQVTTLIVPASILAREGAGDGAAFARGLPGLRRLGVHVVNNEGETSAARVLPRFAAGPLGAQLEELLVTSREPALALELDRWRTSGCRLPVRFDLPSMEAVFADGKLTVEPRSKSAEDFLGLALRGEARDVEIVISR